MECLQYFEGGTSLVVSKHQAEFMIPKSKHFFFFLLCENLIDYHIAKVLAS